jgi:hypothetical protein
MPAWVQSRLPRYLAAPRPPDPKKKIMILEKLKNIIDRSYVVLPASTQFIQSLMEFLDVDKGITDIRLVYNGTSCGLNETLWAPNFWLPTPAAAARVLGVGYYMVDIDLGEMFLNFPLRVLLQRFSRIDLRHYARDLGETLSKEEANKKYLVHWVRCWMGLQPSPFMAVQFYYLAEEFAQGNPLDKKNPMGWDLVRLNLPGDPKYDPTLPRVMKWNNLIQKIS